MWGICVGYYMGCPCIFTVCEVFVLVITWVVRAFLRYVRYVCWLLHGLSVHFYGMWGICAGYCMGYPCIFTVCEVFVLVIAWVTRAYLRYVRYLCWLLHGLPVHIYGMWGICAGYCMGYPCIFTVCEVFVLVIAWVTRAYLRYVRYLCWLLHGLPVHIYGMWGICAGYCMGYPCIFTVCEVFVLVIAWVTRAYLRYVRYLCWLLHGLSVHIYGMWGICAGYCMGYPCIFTVCEVFVLVIAWVTRAYLRYVRYLCWLLHGLPVHIYGMWGICAGYCMGYPCIFTVCEVFVLVIAWVVRAYLRYVRYLCWLLHGLPVHIYGMWGICAGYCMGYPCIFTVCEVFVLVIAWVTRAYLRYVRYLCWLLHGLPVHIYGMWRYLCCLLHGLPVHIYGMWGICCLVIAWVVRAYLRYVRYLCWLLHGLPCIFTVCEVFVLVMHGLPVHIYGMWGICAGYCMGYPCIFTVCEVFVLVIAWVTRAYLRMWGICVGYCMGCPVHIYGMWGICAGYCMGYPCIFTVCEVFVLVITWFARAYFHLCLFWTFITNQREQRPEQASER